MFIHQLREDAVAASVAALPAVQNALYKAVTAGQVSEAEATEINAILEARQAVQVAHKPAIRPNTRFQPRRPQRTPDRARSIERRRALAASGVMPPALACQFTTSELAVLRIIADEVMQHGACRLYLDAIAARAGVSRSTVRNAMKEARRLGLVKVQERPQHGGKNLANLVTVVSKTWFAWLERGPGGGRKKLSPTDTGPLPDGRIAGSFDQNRTRRDAQTPRPEREKALRGVQGFVRRAGQR